MVATSLTPFISSSYSIANILVLIVITLLCIVDFNAYHLILVDFPQNGQIKEALESLLALEKQTRLVSAELHAVYVAYGCTYPHSCKSRVFVQSPSGYTIEQLHLTSLAIKHLLYSVLFIKRKGKNQSSKLNSDLRTANSLELAN